MNIIDITFNELGNIVSCPIDFKILRGGYKDILVNVRVPTNLLVQPVVDTVTGENIVGNNIVIGAIIHTATGQNLKTKRYELQAIKNYKQDGINYRLYQRPMPKEFTLWETVNSMEATTFGKLNMAVNIINWTKGENEDRIEEIVTTKILELPVFPSDYFDEEMEAPSDFSILQSQVQEIDLDLRNKFAELDALGESIKAGKMYYTTHESSATIPTAILEQAEIFPRLGDFLLFPNGDLRKVVDVSPDPLGTTTCSDVLMNLRGLRGEKGDQGEKGETGATGQTGATGATGANGAGVFAMEVQGGELILHHTPLDSAHFEIGADGYMRIVLD